jgi:hypothetical protein
VRQSGSILLLQELVLLQIDGLQRVGIDQRRGSGQSGRVQQRRRVRRRKVRVVRVIAVLGALGLSLVLQSLVGSVQLSLSFQLELVLVGLYKSTKRL